MALAHNDFRVAHIDFRVAHIDFVVVDHDPAWLLSALAHNDFYQVRTSICSESESSVVLNFPPDVTQIISLVILLFESLPREQAKLTWPTELGGAPTHTTETLILQALSE